MTTFAKASFDAAGYLACRPTYPAKVYAIIKAYCTSHTRALDLGCGPGFIALHLADSFEHVTGLDPSPGMIAAALKHERVTYAVGGAEAIPLPDSSVDLVVAGQAAHWFDHARSWGEVGRVLAPGGGVVYVGYGEASISNTSANFTTYAHGTIGPYWSQPGRAIVENLLDAVPFPTTPRHTSRTEDLLASLRSATGEDLSASEIDEPPPPATFTGWDAESAVRLKFARGITRKWGRKELEGYMRTFSALHAYHEAHPEDKDAPGGDVVTRWLNEQGDSLGDEFEVVWPLVLMMIRREG